MAKRTPLQRISFIAGVAIGAVGLLLAAATVLGLLAWAARTVWAHAF